MRTVSRFLRDDSGATAIEYGLIAAGISVAIIAAVQALGTSLSATFDAVNTALQPAAIMRPNLVKACLPQRRQAFSLPDSVALTDPQYRRA